MNDFSILITGFLGVPDIPFSLLKDEQVRFETTRLSIQRLQKAYPQVEIYLAFTGDRVSTHRLVDQLEWPTDKFHYFPQNEALKVFGKGRLEHALILNAIKFWEFPQKQVQVVKVTAKYFVDNLVAAQQYWSFKRSDMYGWRHLGVDTIDTRCFMFDAFFYANFTQCFDDINDDSGFTMERAVFQLMREHLIEPGLFRCRPIVSGLSGSTAEFVRSSFLKKIVVGICSI